MPSSLRDAVEERLTLHNLLVWVAVLAGFRFGFDATLPQLAQTVLIGGVHSLGNVVEDAYDVRESITNVWIGAIAVVGGAFLFVFGDGEAWLPVAFLLIGAWFLLDAVQTVRHEGVTASGDEPDGREVYRDYLGRRVHEVLAERPRTRRELHDAFDADPADVDDAVETLRERGVVVQAGSEFRVPDEEEGTLERISGSLGDLAARVARPLTLGFESDPDETVRERGSGGEGVSGASQEASSAAESAADDRGKERERDREREREFAGD
jgi:hypothetical protein